MTVVTLAQLEGVSGRSAAAVNLAAAFAMFHHKRVLLVDADDQQNTASCIAAKQPIFTTLEPVLLADARVEDAVVPTLCEGVDLLAGSLGLSSAIEELPAGPLQLRNTLRGADYDLCLIDTSASLTMLTINALCAADGLFIPLVSNYVSLQGLERTVDAYRKVRNELCHNLQLFAIAFVIHDGHIRIANEIKEKVREKYPKEQCETAVFQHFEVEEAQAAGRPVFQHAPTCRGAVQYRLLADELAPRLGL
jgi:chromosome partitioning protein